MSILAISKLAAPAVLLCAGAALGDDPQAAFKAIADKVRAALQ